MFHHITELQFNARVSKPDVRFAKLLLEQFGGPNGELKAAMQYFVQAFGCGKSNPAVYDMLMDIETEEFSHLEIVDATFQMFQENSFVCGWILRQPSQEKTAKQFSTLASMEKIRH